MMLIAVHISDGVLAWPWLAGGFVVTAALLLLSAWRLRDKEIPRVAILTAAFFITSVIHVRVPPTSIHLLLSGLVGVVLGPRAAIAIFVGLLLQAVLIGHGVYYAIGVNTCVITLPALLCWLLFKTLHAVPWIKSPTARGILVFVSAAIWQLSAVYAFTLLANTLFGDFDGATFDSANARLHATIQIANARMLDPWVLGVVALVSAAAIVVERRLENAPEFPIGFLIGEISVLATVALNCAVLIAGGEEHWPTPPLVLVVAHLPIALIEGTILGFTVGFLARVKPEMLGLDEGSSPRSPSASG